MSFHLNYTCKNKVNQIRKLLKNNSNILTNSCFQGLNVIVFDQFLKKKGDRRELYSIPNSIQKQPLQGALLIKESPNVQRIMETCLKFLKNPWKTFK